MNLFQKFIAFFKSNKYPSNLHINGRKKLSTIEFKDEDKLFRAYDIEDLDENGNVGLNAIRFPDVSCNWDKFSKPKDILFRENAQPDDGCYSFNVSTSRFDSLATPVHDPIDDKKYPNYSHVEVRQLDDGEDVSFEPPKNRIRKSKGAKSIRQRYRQNLLNSLSIEIEAS